MCLLKSSDVTFDTEASKLVSKNETSHIEAPAAVMNHSTWEGVVHFYDHKMATA